MVSYSKKELRSVQLIELDILKEIISVCNTLSIEYFLIGGSCLGAVRHDGFIPWDDDIDVGMRRKDYDRFLKEAPSTLNKKYYVQSPEFEKDSPYSYTKIRVNGTKFVEYSNRNIKMHQGIYCDIFPFDEVPDNEIDNLKQFSQIKRLNRVFYYRETPDLASPPNGFKGFIKWTIRGLCHLLCVIISNRSTLLNQIYKVSTMYNGTGQSAVACLNFPERKTEYILLSDLYPLKATFFEGITVMVPNNTDVYLTTHYGDWRRLPPVDLQVGHKPYLIEF